MGERAQRAYAADHARAFASLRWRARLIAFVTSALLVLTVAATLALVMLGHAFAETANVKYRGPVDLSRFDCTGTLDSSVVKRVCYSAEHRYMLILLRNTWYHYCEIGAPVVGALLSASSHGKFYNANIKDSGSGGVYSCRDRAVPQF